LSGMLLLISSVAARICCSATARPTADFIPPSV
jgi:hypothetical protein